MSDAIKHECGIALIRLLKPLEYYQLKYGSWRYGLQKLYLLMEKQHNRGQDGAGVVNVKFNSEPGQQYIFRTRSNSPTPIKSAFDEIESFYKESQKYSPELFNDPVWAKQNLPFSGELFLGHLRYGTFGHNSIEYVHPVMRQNNWKTRNLVLAGNFNLTNVDELFAKLIALGQHPRNYTDLVTILEKLGHFLDQENQILFRQYKNEGNLNKDISTLISENIDVAKILQSATKDFDGGYVLAGILGHGDAFVNRDPWGIRPVFYYRDDEIVVVASERPVIQTVFNVQFGDVKELKPGYALIVKQNGEISEKEIRVPQERKSCSFERIYFSRGSDKHIYQERKKLGELLVPAILKTVDYDIENTVFSYIPNTAATAYYGMLNGVDDYTLQIKKKRILEAGKLTEKKLMEILSFRPRTEKIAIKDVKLRTFITEDKSRDDLVGHVYDITYGTIREGVDNLVIIDDSIVRGTTLRQSIIRILDRLKPKRMVIVSSSPQIRYPDCYGIDMAKLADFIAFRAAIELLKETGKENIINEVYKKSKSQENLPKEEIVNHVKEIYQPFTIEQISDKIAQLLTSPGINSEIKIVFQTVENLHIASPNHTGDWYFTGNYPTPGGNKVVNTSFINYIERKDKRAY